MLVVEERDGEHCSAPYLATYRSKRKRVRRGSSLYRPKDEIKQPESALPASTWCMIQDMITNAKSLGDMCVTFVWTVKSVPIGDNDSDVNAMAAQELR